MNKNLFKFASIIPLTLFCALTAIAQQSDNSNKSTNEPQKSDKKQRDNKDCPKSGVARIKVTFHKSGKVTKAELVSSAGCKLLDEQALKAAKNIKFEPATHNGKKVTTVKTVEYTFTEDEQPENSLKF